jgi:hypothetical protein
LPFVLVRFAPIADLPQQIAQLRLFHDALRDPGGPYAIEWLAPNRLSYAILWVAWAVATPLRSGAVAMILLGLLWVAALHGLAARRGRPAASAILATILFFNHFVYWGFLNFAIGWPVFVLWMLLLARPPDPARQWRDAALVFLTAALLLTAHALWFVAGVSWMVVRQLAGRHAWRPVWARFAALVPLVALGLLWYPRLVASGFATVTFYGELPWERLYPRHFVDHSLGGLRGPLEPVAIAVILGWVALGVLQQRRRLSAGIDRELLLAAGLFALPALGLPHLYNAAIGFGERWFPIALTCLVLALPAPSLPRIGRRAQALSPSLTRRALTLVLLAGFVLFTGRIWSRVERTELTGLSEALAALPENPRVMGLCYGRVPELKPVRPFLHMAAYGQALRGGTLDFSFADVPTSLVVFDPPREKPWTKELEWDPTRAKPTDFTHFTHALIGAPEGGHARLSAAPFLTPVTRAGFWRLYRVSGAAGIE